MLCELSHQLTNAKRLQGKVSVNSSLILYFHEFFSLAIDLTHVQTMNQRFALANVHC